MGPNRRFSYLKAPAVIPDLPSPAGMEKPSFPIEVLNILPDQRVPLCKMNEHLSSTLLTVSHLTDLRGKCATIIDARAY